jgi:hypothetical protein
MRLILFVGCIATKKNQEIERLSNRHVGRIMNKRPTITRDSVPGVHVGIHQRRNDHYAELISESGDGKQQDESEGYAEQRPDGSRAMMRPLVAQ